MVKICDTPGCEGHLAKFDDCLTEALWQLTIEGLYDADTGSLSDGFGVYAAFLVFAHAENVTIPSGLIVSVPAGEYMVSQTEPGYVSLTSDGARARFNDLDEERSAWLDKIGTED